jgi:sugar lactone lactonase YvrE
LIGTVRHGALAALCFVAVGGTTGTADAAEMRSVKGLATPESAIVGPDGRIYISEIVGFGKDGDGKITVIGKSGKPEVFTEGMDDPKGMAFFKGALFVADKARIWKVDKQGKASVFAKTEAFPQPPLFLNDLTVDSNGNLYASDTGDIEKGGKGAIFKITQAGKVSLVISESQNASIKSPNGLLAEGTNRLLIVDFSTGDLLRLQIDKGSLEKVAGGLGGGDGLVKDKAGMLYISDWKGGKVWKLNLKQSGARPEAYSQSFQSAADITLSGDGKFILVPDMKEGSLVWLPK